MAGQCQALVQSGESQPADGKLGLSSGHRSELFKMTVPLNENSLMKWEWGGWTWAGKPAPSVGSVCQSMSTKHLRKVNTYWGAACSFRGKYTIKIQDTISEKYQVKQILLLPTVQKYKLILRKVTHPHLEEKSCSMCWSLIWKAASYPARWNQIF